MHTHTHTYTHLTDAHIYRHVCNAHREALTHTLLAYLANCQRERELDKAVDKAVTRCDYKAKIRVGTETRRDGCASKQSQTLSPMAAASGVWWDRRLTARLRVDQRLTGVSSRRGPPASSTRPPHHAAPYPHHHPTVPHPTNPLCTATVTVPTTNLLSIHPHSCAAHLERHHPSIANTSYGEVYGLWRSA